MKNGVKEIVKSYTGTVGAVILNDGTKITCEMVVVGAGIEPAT